MSSPEPYEQFAWYYDSMMDEAVYEKYGRFINARANYQKVLDLGCGTGRIVPYLKQDITYLGIDCSAAMIEIARAYHEDDCHHFQTGDMLEIAFQNRFDLVIITLDALNYLASFESQKSCLDKCYQALSGGHLIFDIHSQDKINHTFHDYREDFDDEAIRYNWHVYKSAPHEITHEISIADVDEGISFTETHIERSYPLKDYVAALKEIGFAHTQSYEMDPGRIVVTAEKAG